MKPQPFVSRMEATLNTPDVKNVTVKIQKMKTVPTFSNDELKTRWARTIFLSGMSMIAAEKGIRYASSLSMTLLSSSPAISLS